SAASARSSWSIFSSGAALWAPAAERGTRVRRSSAWQGQGGGRNALDGRGASANDGFPGEWALGRIRSSRSRILAGLSRCGYPLAPMNPARLRSSWRLLLVAALFACHSQPSVVESSGAPQAPAATASAVPAKTTEERLIELARTDNRVQEHLKHL